MDPAAEYSARLTQRRSARDLLQRRFIQIGNARLAIGISFAVLAWFVFAAKAAPLWSLLIPVVAFVALLIWHSRVIRERDLRERAVRFYEAGLDRLEDRWSGTGSSGEEFRIKDHVYADDLDVFGRGSLFELISRCRTGMGEETLAGWLLQAASREEAEARQQAAGELSGGLDLREDIFLIGTDVRAGVAANRLLQWAATPPERFAPPLRVAAIVLAVTSLVTLGAFFLGRSPVSVLAAMLACDGAFIYLLHGRVERTFEGLARASKDLEVLSLLLGRLEREQFDSVRCRRIAAALAVQGNSASHRIGRLSRIMSWVEALEHALIRALRPLLLWKEQCAFAIDRWRVENGTHVARWLEAVGDFEALSSLASASYERPKWCYPKLSGDDAGIFAAKGLRHPLLSVANCVSNDVELGVNLRLLIISGSNMSGKSTLLRAIGLNTVLAWAGGPVAADELVLSPLQPGASIRISDSLQDNRSRFFAEITRLQQILQLNGVRVLFLLDELLSGTNSHDRRAGAAGVVAALVERGAIGCITTHDLALAEIEREMEGRAVNSHFEDQMVDGQMNFDYKLRPGIVMHSNALELMRKIGLPV